MSEQQLGRIKKLKSIPTGKENLLSPEHGIILINQHEGHRLGLSISKKVGKKNTSYQKNHREARSLQAKIKPDMIL